MKLMSLLSAVLISINVFAGNTDSKPQLDRVVNTITLDLDGDMKADFAYLALPEEPAEEDLDLWIKLSSDNKYFKIEGLAYNMTFGLAGRSNELKTNPQGSLQVVSYNESIGRSRWTEIITFAYRKNTVVLAGYTYFVRDTLDLSYSTCDVNLLSFKGTFESSDGDAFFEVLKTDRLNLNKINSSNLNSLYLENYCSGFDLNEDDSAF